MKSKWEHFPLDQNKLMSRQQKLVTKWKSFLLLKYFGIFL